MFFVGCPSPNMLSSACVVVGRVLPHNMSAKSGLLNAILLLDGPLWYHWQPYKGLLVTSLLIVAALPTTHFCPWAIAMTWWLAPMVIFSHISVVQRLLGLAAFLLIGHHALLCGGGGRRHWHYSQHFIGSGCRCSWSSGLLPHLLHPCGGGRHHGKEGRGQNDHFNPFLWKTKSGSGKMNFN